MACPHGPMISFWRLRVSGSRARCDIAVKLSVVPIWSSSYQPVRWRAGTRASTSFSW